MSDNNQNRFVFSTFADSNFEQTKADELKEVKVKNTVLSSLLALSFTGKLLVVGNAKQFTITLDQRHVFNITFKIKDKRVLFTITMENVNVMSKEQAMLLANVGKAIIHDEYDVKMPFYLDANQPWQLQLLWKTLNSLQMNVLPIDDDQLAYFNKWRDKPNVIEPRPDAKSVMDIVKMDASANDRASLLYTEELTDKVFDFFELGEEFEIESLENRWHLVIDGVPLELVKLDKDTLKFAGLGEISDKNIGAKEKLTRLLNLLKGFEKRDAKRNKSQGFFRSIDAAREASPTDPQP